MNLIELHILQSFPVTCLNRDDLGAPKSAMFGGVERARVSSQCWKRAVREFAHENMPELFGGIRTKLIGPVAFKCALEMGANETTAQKVEEIILKIWKDKDKNGNVNTLFFFSPDSMKNVINPLLKDDGKGGMIIDEQVVDMIFSKDVKTNKKQKSDAGKQAENFLKSFGERVNDAADIALFGRMVANDASLSVEGASLFSHAISTHAVRSELDFFSAVDDEKKMSDDAGAGHIATVEFNSACYYRYVGLNLDLLQGSKFFDANQMQTVVANFIKAVVSANPSARKNSMFGQTFPSYVLGIKRKGQPVSLANAFEKAVNAERGGGYVGASVKALEKEWNDIKTAFSLAVEGEYEIRKGAENTGTLAGMVEFLAGGAESAT